MSELLEKIYCEKCDFHATEVDESWCRLEARPSKVDDEMKLLCTQWLPTESVLSGREMQFRQLLPHDSFLWREL